MSSFDPSIIEKVKKLLARASSSEPHEAALALQMAQRMMAEHNLTMETVEVGEIRSERLRSVATKSKAKGWELRLYDGIAKAIGCGLMFSRGMDYVTDSRMYASYLFIGPTAEVQIARYAAHVLQRQLVRARARFTKGLNPNMPRAHKTGEVDAYCSGWVASALSKVTPLAPHPARALAIRNYMDRESDGGTIGTQQRAGSLDAMARGRTDGEDAELNRPVEGGAEQRSLGSGR